MVTETTLGLACAGFGIGLVLTAMLTPVVMRLARRIDAVDRGGYRKVFRGEMPLLGGLAVSFPLLAGCILASAAGHYIIRNWEWVWSAHRELFSPLMTLAGHRGACLTLAVGGIAIVVLGVLDDMRSLRARWKLLGQIVVGLFVCLSGYSLTSVTVPFLGTLELGTWIGGAVTLLWVVGLINAFNLIDGIDGLASGIAFVGTSALVVLGFMQANEYVMFAGAALAGSLAAFLFFNFPPARIFLGDTGSMFIGFALAMMALIGAQKSETAMIILAPLLALSLPIFETFVSMARRYMGGVPVFAGDNLHTHHRLLRRGYSQPVVVLTLCGTGAVFAVAAVLSAVIREESRWIWFPYALYLGALVNIAWLAGYLRPTNVRTLLERRQRNKVFQALRRYASMRMNASGETVNLDLLLSLFRWELGLRRIWVQFEEEVAAFASSGDASGSSEFDEVRVKTSDRRTVLVRYEFVYPPDQNLRHDVSLCLAGIFEGAHLERFAAASPPAAAAPRDETESKVVQFKAGFKRGGD